MACVAPASKRNITWKAHGSLFDPWLTRIDINNTISEVIEKIAEEKNDTAISNSTLCLNGQLLDRDTKVSEYPALAVVNSSVPSDFKSRREFLESLPLVTYIKPGDGAAESDAVIEEAFYHAKIASGDGQKPYRDVSQTNPEDVEAVRKYLAMGCDVNKLGGREEDTLLHSACFTGRVEIVRLV